MSPAPMSPAPQRRALVVRGGWDGHDPVGATGLVLPTLEREGFAVRVEEGPGVYADAAALAETDLVVQCVTMGEATAEQVAGLAAAVESGTGLVGWHGGIADAFRASPEYLQLVGGQFAAHPAAPGGGHPTHAIEFTALGREHHITAGLDDLELTTEQYWVLSDDLNDVLATTTIPEGDGTPWRRPVTSPAVWTRHWGDGRIVVATPGHDVAVLRHPTVAAIIERGMLWAARTA
jgi:uncharacterized protein